MTEKKPPARPWHPADYDDFDVGSVRAFFEGKADERQQLRARDWILFKLCQIGDLTYRPDSVRDSDFAEGKRFVGLQIVKLSKIPAGALAGQSRDTNNSRDPRRARSPRQ